jgi:hypothetical protein
MLFLKWMTYYYRPLAANYELTCKELELHERAVLRRMGLIDESSTKLECD